MYLCPQLRHFSLLDDTGVATACNGGGLACVHFDFDGHPSSLIVAAHRHRHYLQMLKPGVPPPMVSVWHCGNHSNNLIENALTDTCNGILGENVVSFMVSGAAFLKMGTNYLRLCQALAVEMQRRFRPPILGEPPAAATQLAAELCDFCLRNFKGFRRADEGEAATSSESDLDDNRLPARRQRDCVRPRHKAYAKAWADYLSVFNGEIWRAGDTHGFGPHYNARVLSPAELLALKRKAVEVWVQSTLLIVERSQKLTRNANFLIGSNEQPVDFHSSFQ